MGRIVAQRVLQLLQEMDESVIETYLKMGETLAEQFPRPILAQSLSVVKEQKKDEKNTSAPMLKSAMSSSSREIGSWHQA